MQKSKYIEFDDKFNEVESNINKQALRQRCNSKHIKFICSRCRNIFYDFNQLEVHAFYKHNVATCPHCLEQYKSHEVYRRLVADGDFICKECGESFRE